MAEGAMTIDREEDGVEPIARDGSGLVRAAILRAEEICDPLDRLVERAADDVSLPFTPDVVERLADLKKVDPAAFESLRRELGSVRLPGGRARQGARRARR